MTGPYSGYADRIRSLVEQYRADREAFEPPADPQAQLQAMTLLREGIGPVVHVYVDARTNDSGVEFSEREYEDLHTALNGYLALYAACYGVDADPDATIRSAAELLVDTHNIQDVAAMLTHVPGRDTVTGE
jgi:hypothetical protein